MKPYLKTSSSTTLYHPSITHFSYIFSSSKGVEFGQSSGKHSVEVAIESFAVYGSCRCPLLGQVWRSKFNSAVIKCGRFSINQIWKSFLAPLKVHPFPFLCFFQFISRELFVFICNSCFNYYFVNFWVVNFRFRFVWVESLFEFLIVNNFWILSLWLYWCLNWMETVNGMLGIIMINWYWALSCLVNKLNNGL